MSEEVRREDVTAADGTRLALHRLGRRGATPVVLVPGTFSNHTFWLGTKGHGMARAVADAGFEAVILDPRGHGDSDRRGWRSWTFEQWGRRDVPAAVEAVTADGRRTLLVGHSAGGASALMALAGEPTVRERVAGAVVLATPLPWLQRWRWLAARSARAAARLLGRFPARLLGLGPEDEPPGVMAQWMGWNLTGRWVGEDGIDYVRALAEVRVPVLAMTGAGDRLFAPDEACRAVVDLLGGDDITYVRAGLDTGFSEDFDHPGIVVSKAAHAEVWPRIIRWLEAHAPAPPGGLHPG